MHVPSADPHPIGSTRHRIYPSGREAWGKCPGGVQEGGCGSNLCRGAHGGSYMERMVGVARSAWWELHGEHGGSYTERMVGVARSA
eukprot:353123-Chlamydomonas_euryale.AAC.4